MLQLVWLSYHPLHTTILEMPIKVEEEEQVVVFLKKHGSKRLWLNRLNAQEEKLKAAEQTITELSLRPGGPGYLQAKEHFETLVHE